jgi:hypothetical protein
MKRLQFDKGKQTHDTKLRKWIFHVLLQHNKGLVTGEEILRRYSRLIEMRSPAERRRIHKRLSDIFRTTLTGLRVLGDVLEREK